MHRQLAQGGQGEDRRTADGAPDPDPQPRYEAVVDPSVYDLDVREYIKPEDIVVFPYMEKEKERKKASGG